MTPGAACRIRSSRTVGAPQLHENGGNVPDDDHDDIDDELALNGAPETNDKRTSGGSMQPSELEIQREVETLRDIRRRSTAGGGPGALILDPDLPSTSSTSSSSAYWSPTSEDGSSSSSHDDDSADLDTIVGGDPSHLFWVPARLHPEIAPAEFREFLKEHARTPQDGSISRSSSVSSQGLGRKRSMLSRQYNPSPNDGVEDEEIVPIRRNRTSIYASNPAPQLTISDLQKLEELAEEASRSDDPTKLRSILRRSLSLNVAPTALDENAPDIGDEADSPIIVPRPGQILRRAARTKIRKPGLSGGEGPHRFTSTRARRGGRSATLESDRSSSDHGHTGSVESGEGITRRSGESELTQEPLTVRPESYSEESSIYDAYAREEPDEAEPSPPVLVNSTPELVTDFAPISFEPTLAPQLSTPSEPSAVERSQTSPPVLHHPQPQRVLSPPTPESAPLPSRSPEPPTSAPQPQPELPIAQPQPQASRPPLLETPSYQPPPSPSPSESGRREKDKKGGLFKWGEKSGKKGHKSHEKEKEKEKDGGFFGSLFGKKNKEESSAPPIGGIGSGGREAAVALLGASKSSKNYVPPSPSPTPMGVNGYARYPIHVERAIYRLSHIKLANPRRPLYEQVLISNLMFWYLGVINKTGPGASSAPSSPTTTSPPGANGAGANGNASGSGGGGAGGADKEQAEREKKEREERERAEKERQAALEKERERELQQKKESSRRGSLTKSPPAGSQPRRAEMAVRGPQYDMQHRAMEQEYGGPGGSGAGGYGAGPNGSGMSGMGRTSSAPPHHAPYRTSNSAPSPYQPMTLGNPPSSASPSSSSAQQPQPVYPPQSSIQLVQPQPQPSSNHRYYGSPNPSSNMNPGQNANMQYNMYPGAGHLPPGAMPPVNLEAGGWIPGTTGPGGVARVPVGGVVGGTPTPNMSRSHTSPSPPPNRSASPPTNNNSLSSSTPRRAKSPPARYAPGAEKQPYIGGGAAGNAGVGSGGGGRLPGRSLSATAVAPPMPSMAQMNGLRKGNSAHATISGQRMPSEEEDVPLALYQQQRRK
ncbi:hypothetical protein K474DRAFT_1678501 [Panus rudis PR-1116 ss-1]|nr:hypothetical protein K474DRAFT_1678501 [Panus rudis PR-1116 ss-1]